MRASVCSVAVSGGGHGSDDSHIRNERNCGSAATSSAQRGGARARQADDEHGPLYLLLVDLGVGAVGVLHAQAGRQQRHEAHVLHHFARLREVGFGVHGCHQPFQPFAVRAVAEVLEPGLLPGLGLERVGVERHRANRLLTARRRAARTAWRSSAVTRRVPAGRAAATSANGMTRAVGMGAVSVRT